MKLKSIVLGMLISLIFLTMSCNNAATTVSDLEENNESFKLTQSEIELLRSEGEDVDAFLNGSREYLNSTNQQSAQGIINSFFSSHYKETWVTINGKQTRYSYIAMKGEGKGDTPAHFSTSEATGYGMRLAIYGYKGFPKVTSQGMGFAKAKFKTRFDRLWETQHRFPSTASNWGSQLPGLHSWVIPKEGNTGSTAATDGELDMAYALLEAHKLWGSNGSIDYQYEAYRIIAAIAKNMTNTTTVNGRTITFLTVGDWANSVDWAKYHTRPCDWMLHHFRTFINFLKSAGFSDNDATVKTYTELVSSTEYLLSLNNWKTGLMPEFIQFNNGKMELASDKFNIEMGEDVDYDQYSWNSCRIPWRLAMDVAQNRPMATRIALSEIYYTTDWDNTVKNTGSGYKLDGTITNNAFESAFAAPIVASLVGRMTFIRSSGEGRYFSYKRSKAMSEISTQFSGCQEWGYFGDAILAFSMIVLEKKPEVISSPY